MNNRKVFKAVTIRETPQLGGGNLSSYVLPLQYAGTDQNVNTSVHHISMATFKQYIGGVTLADLNIENVDNTSDLDKPLSTTAIQALTGKANLDQSGVLTLSERPDIISQHATRNNFPLQGTLKLFYMAMDSNILYVWEPFTSDYIPINTNSSVPESYTHEVTAPALTQDISHPLNSFPAVVIVDDNNNVVYAGVQYIDNSTIRVSFANVNVLPTSFTVSLR